METRYPFIATVIGGLATFSFSYMWFEGMGLISFLMFIPLLFLKFNKWALLGGLLVELSFQYNQRSSNIGLALVVGLLTSGIIIQLVYPQTDKEPVLIPPCFGILGEGWWRSDWFMSITFWFMNPLWIILVFTDKDSDTLNKFLAIFFLTFDMFILSLIFVGIIKGLQG